jgi:transcriptional regulator with XRE-family HTH domain
MSLESFSRLLRDRIREKAMNQRDAAASIGIRQATLSNILQAKSFPSLRTRLKLAVWLGIPAPDVRAIVTGSSSGLTATALLIHDPIAVLIHKAGPIARAIACAAVDAERKYHK